MPRKPMYKDQTEQEDAETVYPPKLRLRGV